MTKLSDDHKEATKTADALAIYASAKGAMIATELLKLVTTTIRDTNFYKAHAHEVAPEHMANEMSVVYSSAVNNLIISLLATSQRTLQLIAATGLLSDEGIPWERENFDPNEIFAEADRVLKEAEERDEQDRSSSDRRRNV